MVPGEDLSMLTVTVENFEEITVVRCLGRIVRGYDTVLLCSAAQQAGRNIVLDLTRVDAIDAAGMGALVSLQAAGVYLKLMNPKRQVREILKLTNLDTIFEICESRAALDESKLRGGQIQHFIAQKPLREGDSRDVEKSASPSA
jgi:anti-anti-sigma factor